MKLRYSYRIIDWRGKIVFAAESPGLKGTYFAQQNDTHIYHQDERFPPGGYQKGWAGEIGEGFPASERITGIESFISEMERESINPADVEAADSLAKSLV